MNKAIISVETLTIPTYPEAEHEALPIFAENRIHQRSSGRPYPNKVVIGVERGEKIDRNYTAVRLQNDYIEAWVLPEIGGRLYAARDKTTGYDFFYKQHVIKPALIGALGSWVSGGVEFNWPYHHRPSGFMPCDFTTEEQDDGTVICWLYEHDPVDRMKSLVGIVLRPDSTVLETRVKLCNRTPVAKSFLWWENAAVPVNPSYQIFFPRDVTYVNFHYLDSRIPYPIAGDNVFNGIDMTKPRDISWHKNTIEATSYFACASKYDFFGGYDHNLECGVVHVANHHISPGKKLFTWGYGQLSKSWEKALTDTDGQYAELMAGSYSDNQPNFAWLEPYETKEFSQYWYPISKIGTPDYANVDCALKFESDSIQLQATRDLGEAIVTVSAKGETLLREKVRMVPGEPVSLTYTRPSTFVSICVADEKGATVACYAEEKPDNLNMPSVKKPMPFANEMQSADELYLAGVHVEQYRDPAVMPDAYWLEALKRNPRHIQSLLGMAKYRYTMCCFEEAEQYAKRAIEALTIFNERTQSGDAYYLYALILEALGKTDRAYDFYYKAAWNGSAVSMAMARIACIDLRRGDPQAALFHAQKARNRDVLHPLAPVIQVLALQKLGQNAKAKEVCRDMLAKDPLHLFGRFLQAEFGETPQSFYDSLRSDAAQGALDLAFDLESMGQYDLVIRMLEGLVVHRPEAKTAMVFFTLAYFLDKCGRNAAEVLAKAEEADVGQCFPFRPGEAHALRFAAKQGSAKPNILLGCLLYDKRRYEEAAEHFEAALETEPDNAFANRNLAIDCYSHLGRQNQALALMKKALSSYGSQQMLWETVWLMNRLGLPPKEKIALYDAFEGKLVRNDLVVELAKAYNQNFEPQKALDVLAEQTLVPCEGGEHAIASQYMVAHYLLARQQMKVSEWEKALEHLDAALVLPDNLGAGIWNRCVYYPYYFQKADCHMALGRNEEAEKLYRTILGTEVEFFSNMHLKELPFYQALSACRLGLDTRGQSIMTKARHEWQQGLVKQDNGFYETTPFFISFIEDAAILRRAHHLYLLALVELYDQNLPKAEEMFQESYTLNSDNMFCGIYAHECSELHKV